MNSVQPVATISILDSQMGFSYDNSVGQRGFILFSTLSLHETLILKPRFVRS
jgi:hypothetical protein